MERKVGEVQHFGLVVIAVCVWPLPPVGVSEGVWVGVVWVGHCWVLKHRNLDGSHIQLHLTTQLATYLPHSHWWNNSTDTDRSAVFRTALIILDAKRTAIFEKRLHGEADNDAAFAGFKVAMYSIPSTRNKG